MTNKFNIGNFVQVENLPVFGIVDSYYRSSYGESFKYQINGTFYEEKLISRVPYLPKFEVGQRVMLSKDSLGTTPYLITSLWYSHKRNEYKYFLDNLGIAYLAEELQIYEEKSQMNKDMEDVPCAKIGAKQDSAERTEASGPKQENKPKYKVKECVKIASTEATVERVFKCSDGSFVYALEQYEDLYLEKDLQPKTCFTYQDKASRITFNMYDNHLKMFIEKVNENGEMVCCYIENAKEFAKILMSAAEGIQKILQ